MRSPAKICANTHTYAHTYTHVHMSAQNLFFYLFLFCTVHWWLSQSQTSGVSTIYSEGRNVKISAWHFQSDSSTRYWEVSFCCPPKAIRWPHLMLSIQNVVAQPQRGTCPQELLGRTVQDKAVFSSVPAMNEPRSGWDTASWKWLLFLLSQTQWEMSGAFISHKHKGPAQVSQKSEPKGGGAGRACVECWTQALIRNTGALDRASLYKLLGPVFTS